MNDYRSPFLINQPLTNYPRVRKLANSILGLSKLDQHYLNVANSNSAREFLDQAIDELGIKSELVSSDHADIPKTGPLIIIANHPYGGPEAIALAKHLCEQRKDLKILANFILGRIPEMRELLLLVDPFENDSSIKKNVLPIRIAKKHLDNQGALLIFPAGEVSSYKLKDGGVVDCEWKPAAAYLARLTGCRILPVYITGHNGAFFSVAGFIHPILRTILLPRCLINIRKKNFSIKIGKIVGARTVADFKDDKSLTNYLRHRVYSLAKTKKLKVENKKTIDNRVFSDVIAPIACELLEAEIAKVPTEQVLITRDNQLVFYTQSKVSPNLIQEVGRLREIAFRQIGEGSGKSCDTDRYDEYYDQLICWSLDKKAIVGAYRLAKADEVIAKYGMEGLYTYSLFKFANSFPDVLGHAIELGRSFVNPEFQKNPQALSILWKGVIAYVNKLKNYSVLFGPVTLSPLHSDLSLALMLSYLDKHETDHSRAAHLKPRVPYKNRLIGNRKVQEIVNLVPSFSEISDIVQDLDPLPGGAPVLLKEYLKLNGKFLGFNVDPDFQNSIDGLIRVDIRHINYPMQKFLFGKEACDRYLEYHKELDLKRRQSGKNVA
jgi:putative hemolysin